MDGNNDVKYWEGIAQVFGVSVATAYRRRQELLEDRAIWYQWEGKPPRRVVHSDKRLLLTFAARKGIL